MRQPGLEPVTCDLLTDYATEPLLLGGQHATVCRGRKLKPITGTRLCDQRALCLRMALLARISVSLAVYAQCADCVGKLDSPK